MGRCKKSWECWMLTRAAVRIGKRLRRFVCEGARVCFWKIDSMQELMLVEVGS